MGLNLHEAKSSYESSDVKLLLEPIDLEPMPVEMRERAIAAGRHYSEMIGTEDAPSLGRLRIFRDAFAANGRLLAAALLALACRLRDSARQDACRTGSDGQLVIASIARAGTPVGAILGRWLRERHPELATVHYSLSVIRDRGIDEAALSMVLGSHPASSIRFVDGWTGKGTIARELRHSVESLGIPGLDGGLWVPLDVCGAARQASTSQDFLLPHAILGGTVSGLVSRSVLPADAVGTRRLHRCVELRHLARYDLTRWYLRSMLALMREVDANGRPTPSGDWSPSIASGRRADLQSFVKRTHEEFRIRDVNRLKLGIGETVRVLLRRRPGLVMVDSTARPQDRALVNRLALLRGIEPMITHGSPFAATAIIEETTP